MARGWESKSVEQQQEEKSAHRESRPQLSPEQQQRNRKRDGLLLSRQHLTHQLAETSNPRRRHMLQQALAELDSQLSSLEQLTDPPPQK